MRFPRLGRTCPNYYGHSNLAPRTIGSFQDLQPSYLKIVHVVLFFYGDKKRSHRLPVTGPCLVFDSEGYFFTTPDYTANAIVGLPLLDFLVLMVTFDLQG